MKTCAICIAAYDCVEFLPDLMRGIRAQLPTPGWKYDFRIGVDACKKTSEWLVKNKIKHYMAEKNVGHLILRNSLIYIDRADAYAYFDADDIMMPAYLRRQLNIIEKYKFVMPPKYNVRTDLKIRGKAVVENGGAMMFTHDVIEAVGGFPPYRCAGDTDFMRRAEMAGFTIHKMTGDALYYRRAHAKCLTKASATGIGSDYRKKVWAAMTAARAAGNIKIKPEKIGLIKKND